LIFSNLPSVSTAR